VFWEIAEERGQILCEHDRATAISPSDQRARFDGCIDRGAAQTGDLADFWNPKRAQAQKLAWNLATSYGASAAILGERPTNSLNFIVAILFDGYDLGRESGDVGWNLERS
jgi:hypothetical protein